MLRSGRALLRGCSQDCRGTYLDCRVLVVKQRSNHRRVPQNFLALSASGYYNSCIWHRNIRGFMIQTGDPSGSGKGGQSLWGKPFADEIRSTLKVGRVHTVVAFEPYTQSPL